MLIAAIKKFQVGAASEMSGAGQTRARRPKAMIPAASSRTKPSSTSSTPTRSWRRSNRPPASWQPFPEKKALIYFSSGIPKTGVENQSQLRATVNAAVRANVAFYPVDATGLVAEAPSGDASVASPARHRRRSPDHQRGRTDSRNDQQETLVTLAADTGGKALLDNNDLSLGIRQAQKDINSYYIIGYYSANGAQGRTSFAGSK